MIVTAIQEAPDPLVISTESPLITKACQTDHSENWPTKIIELQQIKPDLSSKYINSIGTFIQTSSRANTPNREKGPKLDNRKNISILNLKKTLHDELIEHLSPDNYIICQMTEFYVSILSKI